MKAVNKQIRILLQDSITGKLISITCTKTLYHLKEITHSFPVYQIQWILFDVGTTGQCILPILSGCRDYPSCRVMAFGRIGSISKWLPHWIHMHYKIKTYISRQKVHFAYTKTYQYSCVLPILLRLLILAIVSPEI